MGLARRLYKFLLEGKQRDEDLTLVVQSDEKTVAATVESAGMNFSYGPDKKERNYCIEVHASEIKEVET